jgi:hypothetical protein
MQRLWDIPHSTSGLSTAFPVFLITWITSPSISLAPSRFNYFNCLQLSAISWTVSPVNPCWKKNCLLLWLKDHSLSILLFNLCMEKIRNVRINPGGTIFNRTRHIHVGWECEDRHKYDPIDKIMSLIKPIQNTSLLTPYKHFYIQSLHKDGNLISKQNPYEPNPLIQLVIKAFHLPSWPCQSNNSFQKVHTPHTRTTRYLISLSS